MINFSQNSAFTAKGLDLYRIKSEFYKYLVKLGKIKEDEISTSDLNIFSYTYEFKQFVEENNAVLKDLQEASKDVLKNLKFNEDNEEFSLDDTEDTDSISFLKDFLNEFIKNDDIKKSIDKDEDEKLTSDEISEFLEALKSEDENAKNLSFDDIVKMYGDVTNDFRLSLLEAPENNSLPEANQPQNQTESTNKGNNIRSGKGERSKRSSGLDLSQNGIPQEKTINNMTEEELKAEKSKAQDELNTNKTKLENINSGSDEVIKSKTDEVKTLYEEYKKKLKEVDEELSGKLDKVVNNISNQESLINEKDSLILKTNLEISDLENTYNNKVSTRKCLEETLSKLNSKDRTNMSEEEQNKLQEQINELNNKISLAKAEEQKALEDLNNKKEELKALEEEKENLTKELEELNNQKAEIEQEIKEKYPEIAESLDNYNNAKKELEEYKNTEASKAQKEIESCQSRIKDIEAALSNLENKKLEKEYKLNGLASEYNIEGITYDVVEMQGFDTLEEFQNFILSKGMTNRGFGVNDWKGQCQNFSNEYGDIMLGTSKIDINSANAAAQAAKGKDRQFQNIYCETQDAALAAIACELQAGRPVVAKIRTPGVEMNHYGLICGIRQGADMNNLKESDFLYMDSYNASIGYLGKRRELTGYKNSIHVWQGQDYNFEYGNQRSYAKRYLSADDVISSYT